MLFQTCFCFQYLLQRMIDSCGGNYTFFEHWPVFQLLAFSVPLKNTTEPLRSQGIWCWNCIHEELQSRVGDMWVAGNKFQSKIFFVLLHIISDIYWNLDGTCFIWATQCEFFTMTKLNCTFGFLLILLIIIIILNMP